MTSAPNASSTSLTTIAIRRHIGTLMLTLTLIVIGVFVAVRLPVDLLPSITYPRIGVRLTSPGIAPEVAIDEITRPLEEALSATEGVVQVFSQTREGRVSLDLYFEPGGDIDQALNDATATLNRTQDSLPDTLDPPRLFKVDPSQLPIYEMAITSASLPQLDLRVFAEQELTRELTRVAGVANVDVSGGVAEEVQVNIDLQRLQAAGVALSDVLTALEERNQDTSGGRLRGGSSEALTRLVGRFQSVEELENLAIPVAAADPPQQIYLRDIADIEDGTAEQRVFVTLNGESAVKVSLQKQPDANTVEVVEGVKARLESLRQAGLIPADMVLTATLDESRFIQSSISNVTVSGLSGAALAALVVLIFLGSWQQTLIITLAIPLAILFALMLMSFFGLTLNVFSLGGLALGTGLVVDNSIVMLENITLRAEALRDRGGSRSISDTLSQVESGSQELESALLASTLTNLVAVLPFLLIGGFVALLFNELILTISFSVAASLLVALTVVPALSARLLLRSGDQFLQVAGPFRWFGQKLDGLTQRYARTLAWTLQRRLWAIAAAVLVFGGSSLWMVGQIPQEILPRISNGQAQLNAQFPPGTTVNDNVKVMSAIEQLFLQQPETESTFSTAGGSLFGSSTTENPLRGSSTIALQPGTNVAAFVDRMNAELSRLPLVDVTLRLSPGSVRGLILSNSPVRADIDVILQGVEASALAQASRQVLAALGENATLARYRPDGEEAQPEVQIRPDWERVADLNLTAQDIGATIETALNGSVVTQLQRQDRLVDIQVQLAPGSVQTPEQLREIPVFTPDGQRLQLGDIATIETSQAPGEIQRINQRQVALIAGSLSEGASLSAALAEVDRILAEVDLPEGVTVLPGSTAEANRQLQRSLQLLGALASFLVFAVMAVQYNSLLDPLIIILTVPLALAGGILGLYVTQTAIGATVIVGAVLLVGIVVNNAIIMVELANQIRDRTGCSYQAAILQAAPQRLRPILMTALTTVLGLFPLALGIGEGSEFLQPLGVVVFSGLSLSTLLTLFIIPCVYGLLHEPGWNQPHPPKGGLLTQPEADPAYSKR